MVENFMHGNVHKSETFMIFSIIWRWLFLYRWLLSIAQVLGNDNTNW